MKIERIAASHQIVADARRQMAASRKRIITMLDGDGLVGRTQRVQAMEESLAAYTRRRDGTGAA
jgi:hypothetical protein